MSEETEGITLEQLQEMAAEQDRLSGYGEGQHPAEVPVAEINQRRGVTEEKADSKPKPKEEKAEAKEESPEPKADPLPEPEAGPPEVPDSSLKSEAEERLAKSETRLNESWKKLNERKEELAERERDVEQLRESLNERSTAESYVDEDGNSAEDYEAAARNFELEGEPKLAEKAREQAESLRERGNAEKSNRNQEHFKKEWGYNYDRAAASYPEMRDPDSPFRAAVNKLLEERPMLATYASGIIDAADIVAMQFKAESSNKLQEQITALQKENDGLKSKLSIGGSEPSSSPSGTRAFNDMSPEEQFAELQRRAAEHDSM